MTVTSLMHPLPEGTSGINIMSVAIFVASFAVGAAVTAASGSRFRSS